MVAMRKPVNVPDSSLTRVITFRSLTSFATLIARDDVQVKVERGLAARGLVVLSQRDPRGGVAALHRQRHGLRYVDAGVEFALGHGVQILKGAHWDHDHMPDDSSDDPRDRRP
jgi:hypothetical protein